MKFFTALAALLGVASMASAVPTAAQGGALAARDIGLVERAAFDVKERALEARTDIPPGIHVIAANSTGGLHALAAAAVNNPFHIGVNVGQTVTLTVMAHAAYWQQVTFSSVPGASGNIVFIGNGEGVPMKQNGQTSYTIPAQSDGYLIGVFFQFSTVGSGGPFNTAVINTLPEPVVADQEIIIEVTSEDSTDSDNNDSYATIIIDTA
ncbi:hypothetical protein PsYK624_059650 [Phanerochaete sordida]|uniref:Uncharacterized protein n=1 Tax=Phanerochaete sordida TaxID=48140 RepID=A0A9P3G8I4_9APHY|nr:hypothetical protein PsYK624_059650 [Phanerochaete sordida]